METHTAPENLKKCFKKLALLKDDIKMLSQARPDDNELKKIFSFFDTIITFEGEEK